MLTRKRRALCSSHRTAREELAVLEIPAVAKQETQRREITVEIQVEPRAALVEIPEEPAEDQAAQEATQEVQAVLAVIQEAPAEIRAALVVIREPAAVRAEPMEAARAALAVAPFSKKDRDKKSFGV